MVLTENSQNFREFSHPPGSQLYQDDTVEGSLDNHMDDTEH